MSSAKGMSLLPAPIVTLTNLIKTGGDDNDDRVRHVTLRYVRSHLALSLGAVREISISGLIPLPRASPSSTCQWVESVWRKAKGVHSRRCFVESPKAGRWKISSAASGK